VAANSLVPESVNVQILRTTFQDNASSIHVRGAREAAESQRLTFTIAENGVIGVGPTASGPQIGILIGTGASGEVKRNIISDHFSTRGDTDYPSVGLLAMDEGLLFGWRQNPAPLLSVSCESNTFRLNQHHLNCFKGNGARISNNTFEGAGAGFRPTGLMLSGESTLVKGNWFSEIPTGITLLGEDPDYGTTLGIARDATLLDNRFCHVTMPVNVQSLAVGITNQGTVLCPLPAPTLTIERRLIVPGTVFLSWPKYPDAWLYELEIAPTPQGTWVPVGKSSLEIHDTKSIALETDNSPRFFRLRSRSQP
jgi:hypothetical protein